MTVPDLRSQQSKPGAHLCLDEVYETVPELWRICVETCSPVIPTAALLVEAAFTVVLPCQASQPWARGFIPGLKGSRASECGRYYLG